MARRTGVKRAPTAPETHASWGEVWEVMQHWFWFSLVMGVLPYGCSVLIELFKNPGQNPFRNSPELLFLSLALCGGALGEIVKSGGFWHRERRRKRDRLRISTFCVLLFGVAISAFSYSWYMNSDTGAPGREDGVNCAFVVEHLGQAADVIEDPQIDRWVHRWGPRCEEWHAAQTYLFSFSLRMAIFFGIASAIAVGLYAPQGGR